MNGQSLETSDYIVREGLAVEKIASLCPAASVRTGRANPGRAVRPSSCAQRRYIMCRSCPHLVLTGAIFCVMFLQGFGTDAVVKTMTDRTCVKHAQLNWRNVMKRHQSACLAQVNNLRS